MRTYLVILSLAAHLLNVIAAPASVTLPVKGKRRFSLPATRAETAERYEQRFEPDVAVDRSTTASVKVAAAKSESPSTLWLCKANSHSWFIPVNIGTPPQSFLLLGDTGAPTVSVANTLEPKDLQGPSPLFNPNKSSTAKQIPGEKYSITFVGGSYSSGPVFRDTFRVGDLEVKGMPIGLTNNHSASKEDSGRSGSLGLSFAKSQSMGLTKEPTFLASIMPYLESGLFTVDWHKATGSGSWDFGFIDKAKYSGNIAYGRINNTNGGSYWRVKVTHGSNDMYAIVDTGTGDSRVTVAIAKDYFSNIQGATYDSTSQAWTFPCTSKLADFKFTVGGTQVAIPSSALSAGSVGNGRCRSHIQVGDADAQTLIWGQDFIAAMFIIFDWDNGRVGFANKS